MELARNIFDLVKPDGAGDDLQSFGDRTLKRYLKKLSQQLDKMCLYDTYEEYLQKTSCEASNSGARGERRKSARFDG